MTNVYIINRDNLERGFRRLVEWLWEDGQPVKVIDNASSYGPLLDWYATNDLPVMYLPDNKGPYAFWSLGLHGVQTERFIVTDPDVVPSADCPHDLIARLDQVLDRDGVGKVGPSLRIDNLPPHYTRQIEVLTWERQFWDHPVAGAPAFYADIDTTFALYPPGSEVRPEGECVRLAPPYSFEHVPWYEASAHPSVEHAYYHAHARKDWVHW